MTESESIGRRVRKYRELRGWSQRMLGARSQTSGSYVNQLESGTLRRPGVERLARIAKALGVSLDEVISGTAGAGGGSRGADEVGTASGDDAGGEQSGANRRLAAIQRELQAIRALDSEELDIILRLLRLRRTKMERDKRVGKT